MGLPRHFKSREEHLRKMKSGETFDVLVIGGGATGCGSALDAASRGLSTVLLERADFASETSSRSTKLIWAGIRYIGTAVAALLSRDTLRNPKAGVSNFIGEFKMVLGAHKERKFLLETQPHLTNWQPIAVPIDKWITWPPPMGHPLFCIAGMVLPIIFKFYDSLSGFACPPSYVMSRKRANEYFPQLDHPRMKYTQVFYEGMHNDARTCLSLALTASEHGASIGNYLEVIELLTEDTKDPKRVTGVKVLDKITNSTFTVNAKAIIFAGGPFTDQLRKLEDNNCAPAVNGAAGTHIVLPGYFSHEGMGLLDINTSDGRFLFFLPWQGHTLVGTTDRKGEALSSPAPPEDEIQWLIREVKKYLSPSLQVRRSDVLSAWRGWRPLAKDPHAPPGAPASRDHIISVNPQSKITFVTGGKWTTYREMAQDVVDRVIKDHQLRPGHSCWTRKIPLVGGEDYTSNLHVLLVQRHSIAEVTARHLAKTYGTRAWEVCKLAKPVKKMWPRFGNYLVEGYPYIESEVEYAVKYEYALKVKDVLSLRTRLAFLNSRAAKQAAPVVADIMAKSLQWSPEEREQQLREAMEYLEQFGGPIPQKESPVSFTDLDALFDRLDVDENGYLDIVEVGDAAKVLGIKVASKEDLEALFQRIPSDHGRVYRQDFIDFWNKNLEHDEILKKIHSELKVSIDKLDGSGVMFG